jgi:hypothetical protein
MTSPGQAMLAALRDPAKKSTFCFALVLLGAALKFWLIANTDISDAKDDPYEYVVQVLHPMGGGVAYGPGTGLFARFFYDLGIPFRFGIEAAFMFALTWVIGALIDWPRKSYLACGLFLFAIFNPAPAELFSHVLSDQIWMVVTMLGLAYLVLALRDPLQFKGTPLICSALLLGFSTITRSVFALLMVALIIFTIGCAALLVSRNAWSKVRPHFYLFLGSMLSVAVGISALFYATCFFNLERLHYFGISAVDCREYRDFYLCLQSVGEPTGVNHFPVDEDRRRLIATAGPQARGLMEQLDRMNLFKDVGFEAYGRHDIALGWFHFAVFAADDSDIDKSYARFKDIEREIHDSARSGNLKVREILPLPDCRLNLVLPAFPGALRSTVRETVHEPFPYPSGWTQQKLDYDDPDFTRALTRHAVYDSPIRFHVWRIFYLIYSQLYTSIMVILLLALIVAYWIYLAFAWKPTQENSLAVLGQQLFALMFMALIFWYALFDASGIPVMSRYMIYHNVMLPILMAYYLRAFVRAYSLSE